MKDENVPLRNAQPVVHASGYLSVQAPGIMEGEIVFPVRGAKRIRLERRPADRIGECAVLICLAPYSQADMVLISEMDQPDYWWGGVPIEGYHFHVRGVRDGKRMLIEFLDCTQPYLPPETLAAMGRAS